ncbi:MAG: BLUF domain-containing protein [Pseudomonadota bacterium]
MFLDQRLMRLVYVSAASPHLTRADLIEMGRTAQRNNQRKRLTGLLLHVENEFFQILEGPAGAVEEVFSRICEDDRNDWVTPLLREHPFRRVFKTWSMGCFDLPFGDLPPEIFFRADWDEVRLRVNADRRQDFYRFLERFYQVHLETGRAAVF